MAMAVHRATLSRAAVAALALLLAGGCKSDRDRAAHRAPAPRVDPRLDRTRIRLEALRAEHSVIATQPMLISTIAQALPLTDPGRIEIDEKLQVFQMRLDETANQIAKLSHASPAQFPREEAAVAAALKRLDEARRAAWKALDDAPRSDRSS